MKKIVALLLVSVMALSLAACGDKPSQGGDAQGNSEPGLVQGGDAVNGSESKGGFNVVEADSAQRVSDLKITGLKMGKDTYAANEIITATVEWTGTPYSDTWIGIIPDDVPHGSEEKNDEYDISYLYFTDRQSGDVFSFEDAVLEPGKYTLRINESDAGGAELAWCAFTVTESGAAAAAPVDSAANGMEKYVNQGAVIVYPAGEWVEGSMGGIEKADAVNYLPCIRLSIKGDSLEECKALLTSEYGSKADFSMEDITVGGNNAVKCTYTAYGETTMEVVIDTAFIGDEFWSAVGIKVSVPEGDTAYFEDEALWDIINSFYFDKALKYSY